MTEIIYLTTLIVLPFFISVFVIAVFLGSGPWLLERLKVTLSLHEDRGLAEQGLLWVSISTPILYFFFLGAISWSGHSISLTTDGLKLFWSISALPLGVLSLALPLSVLVSRLHATKQTAKQIKITQQKNNVDLFYSHRKELFNYFDHLSETKYLGCLTGKYKVHPRVHKNFFIGKPEDGIPLINHGMFEDIEGELYLAKFLLDAIIRNSNPSQTFDMYLANFCSNIYRLSYKLGLPEIYVELAENSTLVRVEGGELLTVGRTTDEAVAAYRYAKNYFQNLCDFAGRELSHVDDENLKYIETGGKYKTVNESNVIEGLHENEIKKANENKA